MRRIFLPLLPLLLLFSSCEEIREVIRTGEQFGGEGEQVDTSGCVVEEVSYESDGNRIAAWVIRPDREGSFPLVVLNHGYAVGFVAKRVFDREASPFLAHGCRLARKGYVVLFSHYRGFGDSEGRQTFGPGEVRDVLAGIDLLKSFPYVNAARIGVVGESEGGMISLFVASRRADIRCVAAVSAPVELGRLFESLPSWKRKVASIPGLYRTIGGTYDEAPGEYRKRSALYAVVRITCPVLIIHGEKDTIVPFEQARLLQQELRRHDKSHESLFIPGAGHSLLTGSRENPISDLVWRRVEEFLDSHLLRDNDQG
ncbi:MAG TPA: alpha/beta fold hydrolase [Spirochaetia bacterium]|nr:alpha/beta fold hydrolase [Spirochaetia bacterium]